MDNGVLDQVDPSAIEWIKKRKDGPSLLEYSVNRISASSLPSPSSFPRSLPLDVPPVPTSAHSSPASPLALPHPTQPSLLFPPTPSHSTFPIANSPPTQPSLDYFPPSSFYQQQLPFSHPVVPSSSLHQISSGLSTSMQF